MTTGTTGLGFSIKDLLFASPDSFTYSEDPNELCKQLVSQLLEVDYRVVINDKIIPFLSNRVVCEAIIQHIVRVPETESNSSIENQQPNYFRERDLNEKALKHSFNAVYILLNRNNMGMKSFISSSTQDYLNLLLRAFLPHSDANLNHVKMVLSWSMENFPEFKRLLLFESNFIELAVNYLHETPISELLLTFITNSCKVIQDRNIFERTKILHIIISRLTNRIDEEGNEIPRIASDFMTKLISDVSAIKGGELAFNSINNNKDLVDQLLSPVFDDQYLFVQQKYCLNVFTTLYLKIQETHSLSKPIYQEYINSLSLFREKMNNYVSSYLQQFCAVLIESRNSDQFISPPITFSSYSVKSPLTEYRIQMLEIIVQNVEYDQSALFLIPNNFWHLLVFWYFENCNNSIFLIKFARIFKVALFSNNEDVFKKITKTKFVTRMIDSFLAPEYSGCRCFSLLICNQLRLFADAHPTSHVKHYLFSHGSWLSFIPTLRKETVLQVLPPVKIIKMMNPNNMPAPVVSPNLPRAHNNDDGIDLGSAYAISIGVDTLPNDVVQPTPSKKKKKKSVPSLENYVVNNTIDQDKKNGTDDDDDKVNQDIENSSREADLKEDLKYSA